MGSQRFRSCVCEPHTHIHTHTHTPTGPLDRILDQICCPPHLRPSDLLPFLKFRFQASTQALSLSRALTPAVTLYLPLVNQRTGLGEERAGWTSAPPPLTPPQDTIAHKGPDLPLPLLSLRTALEKDLEGCWSTRTSLSNPSSLSPTLNTSSFGYSSLTPRPHLHPQPPGEVTVRLKPITEHRPQLSPCSLTALSLSVPSALFPGSSERLTLVRRLFVSSTLRPHHQGLRYSYGILRGDCCG